jgi:hypothetical protein
MKLSMLLIAAVLSFWASSVALAQQAGNADKPAEPSVDEKLLDSLGGDLLEGLDDIPTDPGFDQPDATDPSDKPLLDQLEGEDIGAEGENDLSRISRQMKLVQERIARQEVSEKTQGLQKQIVADLDALIQQIQQQQKKQQGTPSNSKTQNPGGEVKQPGNQPNAGQPQQPNEKPSRDSEERLTERDANPVDAEAMQAMIKRVWGHLPDRVRQEMQNATVEEFLPKYQELIEDYFRRLAEEE